MLGFEIPFPVSIEKIELTAYSKSCGLWDVQIKKIPMHFFWNTIDFFFAAAEMFL